MQIGIIILSPVRLYRVISDASAHIKNVLHETKFPCTTMQDDLAVHSLIKLIKHAVKSDWCYTAPATQIGHLVRV